MEKPIKLPTEYSKLDWRKGEKAIIRDQYIVEQNVLTLSLIILFVVNRFMVNLLLVHHRCYPLGSSFP